MPRTPLSRERREVPDSREEQRKPLRLEDLEEKLLIDEHQLEREWQDQPQRYHQVAKELAYAISERDAAAQSLKETEAEVDGFIRAEAEERDEKITEKAVESKRRMDRSVIAAQRKLSDLSLRVGLLQALVGSFAHRRDALENLVKLYLAHYYGSQDIGNETVDGRRGGQTIRDVTASRARAAQREARRSD